MSDLQVALVQADLAWEDKAGNLRKLEQMVRDIPGPVHIVFLPEMFSTGFSMEAEKLAEPMDGPTVQWMRNLSREKRVILAGSLIIREEDAYYNRFIWMLPNGQLGSYDKRHLFGYAGEDRSYTPGYRRLITSVNGWKLNCLICYDLRFPVWARQNPALDQPEYDVLVYVANWPDRRRHAWRTLLQARAIENQCYVVGVNRVGTDAKGNHHAGDSMVVDPLGHILSEVNGDNPREEVIVQGLSRSGLTELRQKLPFLKDADPFLLPNLQDEPTSDQ